jgi:hypothetical protein
MAPPQSSWHGRLVATTMQSASTLQNLACRATICETPVSASILACRQASGTRPPVAGDPPSPSGWDGELPQANTAQRAPTAAT